MDQKAEAWQAKQPDIASRFVGLQPGGAAQSWEKAVFNGFSGVL